LTHEQSIQNNQSLAGDREHFAATGAVTSAWAGKVQVGVTAIGHRPERKQIRSIPMEANL